MAECKCEADDVYEADGTIHVRYGSSGKVKSVTFIPLRYVEQSGSKFVIFAPRDESVSANQERSCKIGKSLTVKASGLDGAAKGAELVFAEEFGDPLLHAAVHGIKVTVVVSCSNKGLALKEIVVPTVPKSAT